MVELREAEGGCELEDARVDESIDFDQFPMEFHKYFRLGHCHLSTRVIYNCPIVNTSRCVNE